MVHISNKDADALLALLNVTLPVSSSLREQNKWRLARIALKRLSKKRNA